MENKVIKIDSFTQAGSTTRANEDNCFVNNNFGFVVDGATGQSKVKITDAESDAKWFSSAWKEYLIEHLSDTTLTISEIVKNGIVEIDKKLSEFPNYNIADIKPSAAIAIFRVNQQNVEYFVLADCTLVITNRDGSTEIITNDDIGKIDNIYLNLIKTLAVKNNLPVLEAKKLPEVREFIAQVFKNRNTANGGWVLRDSFEAVDNAKTGQLPLNEIETILGLSDGFSQIFDLFNYVTPKKLSDDIKQGHSLEDYYKILYDLQESDKECEVYLRSKLRDDATLIKYVIES